MPIGRDEFGRNIWLGCRREVSVCLTCTDRLLPWHGAGDGYWMHADRTLLCGGLPIRRGAVLHEDTFNRVEAVA